MTEPSITYGHGYLSDCDDKTSWTEDGAPTLTDTDLTVEHGDFFKVIGTATGAGESTYWVYDITDIPQSTYKKFLVRWKTSASSNGIGAKVVLDFSTDLSDTQTILDTGFNTSFQVASGDITTGKTMKRVLFYGVSDAACTAEYAYYDFLLLHKGTFTFPYVHDIHPVFDNRYVDIAIPGRLGDITQYLGAPSPSIRLTGKLDIGDAGSPTYAWGHPALEYLYRIWQEAHSDPWQWFSTGGLTDDDRIINCKVTLRKLDFTEHKEATRDWTLDLKHYSLSSGDETTSADMQWIGI